MDSVAGCYGAGCRRSMALFTSTYLNKVDRKGRVSVPAPFRAALDGSGGSLVFVKPNHPLGAIDGLSEAWMEQIQDRIDELDIYSEERIALETREFAETTRVPLDPEGRTPVRCLRKPACERASGRCEFPRDSSRTAD